jgi:hypothetical protein
MMETKPTMFWRNKPWSAAGVAQAAFFCGGAGQTIARCREKRGAGKAHKEIAEIDYINRPYKEIIEVDYI